MSPPSQIPICQEPNAETVVGLDIGGANIKIADSTGNTTHIPFAMWSEHQTLPTILEENLNRFEPFQLVATTMTGELADCFESKSEGVSYILQSLVKALGTKRRPIIYSTKGFLDVESANRDPFSVAAANWHASATFLASHYELEFGLIIDCGSTTVDVIPIQDGRPIAQGYRDVDRLTNKTLVYTGVKRTPLMSLGNSIQVAGKSIGTANEMFATTADIYRILGQLDSNDEKDSADGRSNRLDDCHRRIAKMICSDTSECDFDQAIEIAKQYRQRQIELIGDAVDHQLLGLISSGNTSPIPILVFGEGEFLVREALAQSNYQKQCHIKSLSGEFNEKVSRSLPAFAVACLAVTHSANLRELGASQ